MVTILVLEDNPELARLLRQALDYRGCRVLHGATGAEGLEQLHTSVHRPDAIFCDLHMPGMDGAAFLRAMRAREDWAGIPVVIMSGSASDTLLDEPLARAAAAILPKPFGLTDLDRALSRLGLNR